MAVPRPVQFPRGGRRPLGGLVRNNYPVLGLALTAGLLALLIGRDVIFPPVATTAASARYYTVANGNVTTSVTATGTLVPAQAVNLGFKSGGQLTEVDVKSGDRVIKGQPLAKIDDTQLGVALQQAQAALASAEASLRVTLDGAGLAQAQHAVDSANQSVADAGTTLAGAQAQLAADQGQLATDQAAPFFSNYQSALASLQASLAAAQAQFRTDGCAFPPPATGTCSSDYKAVVNAQNDIAILGSQQPSAAAYPLQTAPFCAACASPLSASAITFMARASAAVTADTARVTSDGAAVSAAQRGANQAAQALQTAQDSLNTQTTGRPATIAQQQAAVAAAQAGLTTAQQNAQAAVLTAPFDGTISAVNAQVGDTVGAFSSSAQAQAPGSTAPLPSTGSGTGSSGLMTLLNSSAYQAVVSFAESDAAKVKAGMPGTVTFDAVTGLSVPAHVLAVAASSTVSSNVVNYYVTLTLDNLNSQLRPGLTANATVVTATASGVPLVPNSAITRLGAGAFVTAVDAAGKQTRVPVQTGVAGSSFTQITSGIGPGDRVVLPQLRSSSTGAANGLGRQTTVIGGGGFSGRG